MVACPGAAADGHVLQHGLEPVEGPRELRVGGPPLGELVPQPAQAAVLVRGQQGEDAVGGRPLRGVLPGLLLSVGVGEQVPGVDLHQVVQQDHGHDTERVDPGRRVVAEYRRHHGQVPRVLGRVLLAAEPGEDGLPEHPLEPADLGDEPHLLLEPLHGPAYCGPNPSKCNAKISAANPIRIATVLTAEIWRCRRSLLDCGRLAAARFWPVLAAPGRGGWPGGRRSLRVLLALPRPAGPWRLGGCGAPRLACLARSAADGSVNLAASAMPEVSSRN